MRWLVEAVGIGDMHIETHNGLIVELDMHTECIQ